MVCNDSEVQARIATFNHAAFLYLAPPIVFIGLIGDILTIYLLSQPVLRSASVIYMYLRNLACTDLMLLVSLVPMLLYLGDVRSCNYFAMFYYAHIGFTLVNGLMGTSIWIVIFLTICQYVAICHPFKAPNITKKLCFYLTGCAYLLSIAVYIPYGFKFKVVPKYKNISIYEEYNITSPGDLYCYKFEDNDWLKESDWVRRIFTAFEIVREICIRGISCVLLFYFNFRIILSYRKTQRERMARINEYQRGDVTERGERDQRRLCIILMTIVAIFIICTLPALPFPILVKAQNQECDEWFQMARSITNIMECSKFALNFYLYCMINPDIRKLASHKLRCHNLGSVRVPMEHSRTDIRSLTRLLQAADQLSMRHSTQILTGIVIPGSRRPSNFLDAFRSDRRTSSPNFAPEILMPLNGHRLMSFSNLNSRSFKLGNDKSSSIGPRHTRSTLNLMRSETPTEYSKTTATVERSPLLTPNTPAENIRRPSASHSDNEVPVSPKSEVKPTKKFSVGAKPMTTVMFMPRQSSSLSMFHRAIVKRLSSNRTIATSNSGAEPSSIARSSIDSITFNPPIITVCDATHWAQNDECSENTDTIQDFSKYKSCSTLPTHSHIVEEEELSQYSDSDSCKSSRSLTDSMKRNDRARRRQCQNGENINVGMDRRKSSASMHAGERSYFLAPADSLDRNRPSDNEMTSENARDEDLKKILKGAHDVTNNIKDVVKKDTIAAIASSNRQQKSQKTWL